MYNLVSNCIVIHFNEKSFAAFVNEFVDGNQISTDFIF
jgi:hypothetical protein